MTRCAVVAAWNMTRRLSGANSVVMTLCTSDRRLSMIKVRVIPDRVAMTVRTIIVAYNMGIRFTGSVGTIMATKTICTNGRVVDTTSQPA